jgi:hypothetical protein
MQKADQQQQQQHLPCCARVGKSENMEVFLFISATNVGKEMSYRINYKTIQSFIFPPKKHIVKTIYQNRG